MNGYASFFLHYFKSYLVTLNCSASGQIPFQ